ncbi:MAG: hydroxymethylbilane synthase [Longimicrobiales bacterium]|nr:hydroxymethylbilane synthase [Longimicrobiales bacterium]
MTQPVREELLLGTRASALALWQAEHVSKMLREASSGVCARPFPLSTLGDRSLDAALSDLGGASFSSEIDQALLGRRVRVAVHSLKDLPIQDNAGIVTAAILSREDPRDALVSSKKGGLAQLPIGAKVGTSSPRRAAQIKAYRADLIIKAVRGNVETRVRRAIDGPLDAVILAAAGLNRLGLTRDIQELLSVDDFVPAPGQAALAVQCREDDAEVRTLLGLIDDKKVRTEVQAERAFLAALGGGCSLPVGALATSAEGGALELTGFVGAVDGSAHIQISRRGSDPLPLARALAAEAFRMGAREILG